MNGKSAPDHQVLPGDKEWRCSCGTWTFRVPPVRNYGDTTLEARGQQLMFAHNTHVRRANRKITTTDVHALVLGLADRFRHKDSAPPSPAREADRLQKARAIDQMLKAGDGDDGLDFQ